MTDQEKEVSITKALTEPMSSRALGDFAGLTSGQMYPTLMRMERDGKIISAWADEAYPRRRIYRLAE